MQPSKPCGENRLEELQRRAPQGHPSSMEVMKELFAGENHVIGDLQFVPHLLTAAFGTERRFFMSALTAVAGG
jgi:hypothetical protein